MVKTVPKWKMAFFPAKNVIFGFWPKIQKLTPLYYSQKIWIFIFRSRICNTLPNGALRRPKWHFLGTFWPKMAFLGDGAHLKITISFGFSMGSNSHRCSCRFLILAFFSHFWLIFKFLWNQKKIQNLTPLYYSGKFWIFIFRSRICHMVPNGALRRPKWHFWGTFWPKMAFLGNGAT